MQNYAQIINELTNGVSYTVNIGTEEHTQLRALVRR